MKLLYKGKFKGVETLPKADLPENAVAFDEPKDPESLVGSAIKYMILAWVVVLLISLVALLLRGGISSVFHWAAVLGFVASFLTVIPHELLHGICFGRDAQVELYADLRRGILFVVSTQPVSKGRFIFLSLLPNLIFGGIPWILWLVLPLSPPVASALFSFSFVCIGFGAGDYLNVVNALRQMPKGSMQVLSGFNSYWYIP